MKGVGHSRLAVLRVGLVNRTADALQRVLKSRYYQKVHFWDEESAQSPAFKERVSGLSVFVLVLIALGAGGCAF